MPTQLPFNQQAAAARMQRAQAACLLADSARRAALDWSDLHKVPAWATVQRADLEHLTWCVGVWFYANELQHSIDGRLLSRLQSRLGAAAFDAMMTFAASVDSSSSPQKMLHQMLASDLDEVFLITGREGLLSSIDSDSLRRSLGDVLWPGEVEVTASARRQWLGRGVVEHALSHACAAQKVEQGMSA